MARCRALQYSDQMNCTACGLVWDVNDPDPPPCKVKEATAKVEAARKPGGVLHKVNRYWRAKNGYQQ